jgi:hypothetical protein
MSARPFVVAALAALALAGCRDAFRTAADATRAATDSAAPAGILTMERLRMWNQAVRNLAAAGAADPALARAMQSRPGEPPESLLTRINALPPLRDAIGRAGLTTTQYMLVNTGLFRAMVTTYALEEGRIQAIPPGENVADVLFVQRNGQEIRRMVTQTRQDLFPLVGEIGAPPPPDSAR